MLKLHIFMKKYRQRYSKKLGAPMTDREIRKAAKLSILNGKTKQETFVELKGKNYKSAKKAANIIHKIPSLRARSRYKIQYITLIALLSIVILVKMRPVISFIIEDEMRILIIFLLPIINILVGVARYRQSSYITVALLSYFWQFYLGIELFGDTFEPLLLIDVALAAGLIELSSTLHSKLYPEYMTVKEPYKNKHGQNRLRIVIKFED